MVASTNLSLPTLPSGTVPRARLLDKLQQGRHKKLTMVIAPAGYGKTTLLAAWGTQLAAEGWHVGWCSLQKWDNDNGRFWQTVHYALHPSPTPWNPLTPFETTDPTKQVVNQFIEQLYQLPRPTILFLDDYHHIYQAAIHEAIQTVLTAQPTHFHLVIGSRHHPPFQLARWRANQQLTELTQRDLAFSVAETAILFQDPSTAIIKQLTTRTAGWVAGLQLVRLMQQSSQADLATLLPNISGTQQTIFDYLSEEVFQHQPRETQRFLLQTSILEQLTADLCQAMVVDADSHAQLTYLVRHNLFIIQLDTHGNWYRYHPLFAQFLQRRLKMAQLDKLSELHQRASNWHRQKGLAETAVNHALATADKTFAFAVLTEQAPNLLRTGNTNALVQAVQQMAPTWSQHPSLSLTYALAQILRGQTATAEAVVDSIHPHLQPGQLGVAYVIQTILAQRQGNVDKMLATAEKAHRHLDPSPTPLNQLLGVNLAELYSFRLGKNRAALELLAPLQQQLKQEASQPYLFFHTVNLYAATYVMQGELQTAYQLYQQAVALGDRWQTPYLLGAIHAGLGKICLEWHDLATAEQHLRAGLRACRQMQAAVPLISNAIALARLLWTQGQQAQAKAVIAEARQDAIDSPTQLERLTHWQRWRKADNGWVGITVATLPKATRNYPNPPSYPLLFAQLKAIQLEVGKWQQNGRSIASPAQLRQTLKQLYGLAQHAGQIDTCLDIGLTQVVLEERLGQTAVALNHLHAALHLAQPHGYLHTFLDTDPIPYRLLKQSEQQQTLPEPVKGYAKNILDAGVRTDPNHRLPDPLTTREQDVLTLLGQGLTNQAIATHLHLSVGTVRWHARNIYGKLAADNRTHAVARARTLGLLT